MKRQTMISVSDCSSSAGRFEGKNGERYSNLERMGSIKNILSGGHCGDSHNRDDKDIGRKFINAPAEATGVGQYKGMVLQPNGGWGADIYEKRQRVWPGTFNGEDETADAIAAFKFGRCDALKPQLEARFLSVHCKGETVDMFSSKHTYEEDRQGHSKNNDRSCCSETNCEVSEMNYSPGGGGDDKKASSWRQEHMFDKAVTPSDVGKLNRLVIPKQHAEKYLPLDKHANEKGLLLNFEDSKGKEWRFQYSYWNSSQSYVLTKGWRRFVKEKKLDAGDIVSFHRATHQDPNLQRLFISCRRKPCSTAQPPRLPSFIKHPFRFNSPFQFPSDAINNIGGSHGQHLISTRALIPQWAPLFWPANNMRGEYIHGAAETQALQANAQPMDLLTSLSSITTDHRPKKSIHDSGSSFSSIQKLSINTSDCGRPPMDTEISVRAPPLHAIQLKSRGMSRDDLSRPIKNKVPEASATSFDHSTSKKIVRLFGVDVESK